MKDGKCEVKRCRQEASMIYYGHDVCEKCWTQHCNDDEPWTLKQEFNIKEKRK